MTHFKGTIGWSLTILTGIFARVSVAISRLVFSIYKRILSKKRLKPLRMVPLNGSILTWWTLNIPTTKSSFRIVAASDKYLTTWWRPFSRRSGSWRNWFIHCWLIPFWSFSAVFIKSALATCSDFAFLRFWIAFS